MEQRTNTFDGPRAVLGVDIVSFSLLSDDDQVQAIEALLRWIQQALFGRGVTEDGYRWSPAGDGGYLTFTTPTTSERAIDVAFLIAELAQRPDWKPQSGDELKLTLALHVGTVIEAPELGRSRNIWGSGINMAARLLSLAVPGQMLISRQYFDTYLKGRREKEFEIGEMQCRTVKHNVAIEAMNIDRHNLCLSDATAKDLRWNVIGGLWQRTVEQYKFLIHDSMKSGDPVAALAAAKFLLDLGETSAVRQLCEMIGRTGQRPDLPYPHQTHPIFGVMPPEGLLRVLQITRPLRLPADNVLVRKGDPANSCFFPVSGTLLVAVPGQKEPVKILPGAIVGEFGLWMANIRRTATVTTADECLVLEIDRDQFKQILNDDAQVAEQVYGVVKGRILENVLNSHKIFPLEEDDGKDALSGLGAECERYDAGAVLNLDASLYIMFSGKVRLAPPGAQPLVIEAAGTIGAEQVIGIVSDIGSPDGATATVLEETFAVKIARSAVTDLQRIDSIGRAWSALCGERQRTIRRVAAAAAAAQSSLSTESADRRFDVFLSYASEDKEAIARPLFTALEEAGLKVWFDEAILELGDDLEKQIEDGLSRCRYGVVILSQQYLEKAWTQRELDALLNRETESRRKAILPIWHGVNQDMLTKYPRPLAGRLAARFEDGIPSLVRQIAQVVKR